MSDQVGDYLGVRLGLERAAVRREPFFQRKIVLNDAVMDDHDLARLISVRMDVLLGRPTVRGPARMADAVGTVKRIQPDAFLEVAKLPFRPAKFEMVLIIRDGYPGRIVTAILELPKAVDDQRYDLFIPNVTDNSAHLFLIYLIKTLFPNPKGDTTPS